MVAPALIAGLGALGGIAFGAIADALGRKKTKLKKTKLIAVTWIAKGQVQGMVFRDFKAAVKYQDDAAQRGQSSILVEKDGESYKGLRPIRAVAAGGRKIDPNQLRRMQLNDTDTVMDELGVGSRDFDTNQEALDVTQATTRLPTPEWARRAQQGPYPETNPGKQEYLPESPLFRQTTSSHEWKTDVNTWPVPDKFFPGRQGMPSQPDEFVVEQALQYPERSGGPASSDMTSPAKKTREKETHGERVREAAHSAERGREHGMRVREEARRK
jgi:hypothetical protein